jgi:hypothetical protein
MRLAYSPFSKMKKLLIITSSGGGGLIQAANAKEQEIHLKYPNITIIRRDVLKDWVWKWMGFFSIKLWNTAQKKGNVRALKFLCINLVASDFLFAPHVFFKTLYTLLKEDIDHVIDTQPLCTASIVKALRLFHWFTGKKIYLEKVLVDFPTRKATHYFRSIRNLSKIDRSYIKVTTIAPFLENGESSQEFWQKNCRLPEEQVNYEPFYVRQSFCKYHKKPRLQEPLRITVKIKNSEELFLIKQSVQRGCLEVHWTEKEAEFVIGTRDRVFTILLGSQPAHEGTLNYVRKFLTMAQEYDTLKVPSHLFIFCANHRPHGDSLLKKVSELVVQTNPYPKFFSVVPLSFQDDEVIAPIFHRSDSTCTRSGGHTLMELICVAPKQIWIHSEAKKSKGLTQKDLLAGIVGWESANAVYMQDIYGAKIVTPDSFSIHAKEIFLQTADEAPELSNLSLC